MKGAIITVGDEVVFGHTVNTNASVIAEKIQEVGITPSCVLSVCDNKEQLQRALTFAVESADVILLTGGLGPTPDDLTKEVLCKWLNQPLVLWPEEVAKLENYFKARQMTMPENNKKQAAFPKEAILLNNDNGTAPGMLIEARGKIFILLPGPPREMKPMLMASVLPYFKARQEKVMETLDIRCFNISESELAEKINDLIGEYEWGSVATYVGNQEIIVRLHVQGTKELVNEKVENYKNIIEARLEAYIIGYNEESLEEQLVGKLLANNLTVATVESCTGGLVAGTLVNCGGVSSCFEQGIVTYSNEAKMQYVGVKAETLAQFGAVSEETAREMAEGIRRMAKADIGLSTTGIAGPGGGTKEKPVGLVYIGIATKNGTDVWRLQLKGSRQAIRLRTVKTLLFNLYKKLQ